MTSPNETQISLCMRKYNLEQLENEFLSQYLKALPDLEEENQQQSLKVLNVLRKSRAVCIEAQDLRDKKGRLIAELEQKKREVNDLQKMLKENNEQFSTFEQLIEQEEIAMNRDMDEYDAKLCKMADIYRQFPDIYDEEFVKGELEKEDKILSDLLAEEKKSQDEFVELKQTLDNMKPDVPDNIVSEILGGKELEQKLKSLSEKYST